MQISNSVLGAGIILYNNYTVSTHSRTVTPGHFAIFWKFSKNTPKTLLNGNIPGPLHFFDVCNSPWMSTVSHKKEI